MTNSCGLCRSLNEPRVKLNSPPASLFLATAPISLLAREALAAEPHNKPALGTWLKEVGSTPFGGTPEAFGVAVRQNSDYHRDLIKAANLQLH